MIQTVTRRYICFASIVEGDLDAPERQRCEAALFARLSEARVGISMISVHDGGCAFAVDEYDLADVRKALESLNVAVSVRMRCARITLRGRDVDASPRLASCVIAAIAEQGIATIHVSAGPADVAVLVADRDAVRTQVVMSESVTLLSPSGI